MAGTRNKSTGDDRPGVTPQTARSGLPDSVDAPSGSDMLGELPEASRHPELASIQDALPPDARLDASLAVEAMRSLGHPEDGEHVVDPMSVQDALPHVPE